MRIGTVVVAAAAALLAGCASELDVTEQPAEHIAAQAQTNDLWHVVPNVDHATVALPESGLPEDPCDCPDLECVDAWAEAQLSCNVCIVLLCDDEWHPHVCHHC